MRELELELEECKQTVRSERMKVEAKEGLIDELRGDRKGRDKGKSKEVKIERDAEGRYKEFVEEKKGVSNSYTTWLDWLI